VREAVSRVAVACASWLLVTAVVLVVMQRVVADAVRTSTRDRYAHRDMIDAVLGRPVARRPFVVWMGDSTVLMPRGAEVPSLVEELAGTHPPIEVRAVAGKGFDFYAHYFVLERVLALRPDLVVLVANLRALAPNEDAPGWYDDLASALPVGELPRAFGLPLAPARLGAARLVLMQCLRVPACEAGAIGLDDFRTWANDSWRTASQPVFGPERGIPPPTERYMVHRLYDVTLAPDAAMPRMLDAIVGRLHAAGIPVLVYAAPAPVQVLRAEGLDEAERRNVAVVGEVTVAGGGRFVDLHEALDGDEVDKWAHYSVAGSRKLASLLHPIVVRALVDGMSREAGGAPARLAQ
jgi:hypothetical protein